MIDYGLEGIRRRCDDCVSYFMANHTSEIISGKIPLATKGHSVAILDPMTGREGVYKVRDSVGSLRVPLKLLPGETRFLKVSTQATFSGPCWKRYKTAQTPIVLKGDWHIEFIEGGPTLPRSYWTSDLDSWTRAPDAEARRFAGTARYTLDFDFPSFDADRWVLDLGDVRESARVRLNGEAVGLVFAHPFRVDMTEAIQQGKNTLEIEVTNLSANRIRDLDRRNVLWKKFHDINLVNHLYEPFDAGDWELKPSGLLGPVRLIPEREMSPSE
jgi:hypothetical protein